VALLKFPDDKEEWKVILLLRELRNILVHNPDRFNELYFNRNDEKIVDPKLLDYFWIVDPRRDMFFEELDIDSISDENMFSAVSIHRIIMKLIRFSEYIDEAFEERNKLRKKFQKGPKHKK
jgi:hypothetical protein